MPMLNHPSLLCTSRWHTLCRPLLPLLLLAPLLRRPLRRKTGTRAEVWLLSIACVAMRGGRMPMGGLEDILIDRGHPAWLYCLFCFSLDISCSELLLACLCLRE